MRAHSSHPKVVAEYLDCRILHLIALLDSCHSNVHQDPQVSVTWQHKLKNKHSAQQSTKFGNILLCFIIKKTKKKRTALLAWPFSSNYFLKWTGFVIGYERFCDWNKKWVGHLFLCGWCYCVTQPITKRVHIGRW